MSVSTPERSTRPGTAPVKSPSADDLGPVDQDVPDARPRRRRGGWPRPAGRRGCARPRARWWSGSNTTTSAKPPGDQPAPVAQPVETGRDVGQQPHRLLPAEQPPRPHPVAQHGGRVDGAAHGVEVGAGVGAAHDGPRVLPDLRPAAPSPPRTRRWAAADPVRRPSATTTSSRASKGSMPRSRGHVADRPAFELRVLGGERLVDDQPVPHRQVPQNPRLVGLGPGVEAPTRRRVGQRRHALVDRERRRPHATPAGRRGWRRARSSAAAAWCGAASGPRRSPPGLRRPPSPRPAGSQAPSGFMAETPSTFQLTGRSASSDMRGRGSRSPPR